MKINMKKFAEGKSIVFFRSGVEIDNFLMRCERNGIKWIGEMEATSFNPQEGLGVLGDIGLYVTPSGMTWREGEEIMCAFIYADEKPDEIIRYQGRLGK